MRALLCRTTSPLWLLSLLAVATIWTTCCHLSPAEVASHGFVSAPPEGHVGEPAEQTHCDFPDDPHCLTTLEWESEASLRVAEELRELALRTPDGWFRQAQHLRAPPLFPPTPPPDQPIFLKNRVFRI
jgi:hypothetical protein